MNLKVKILFLFVIFLSLAASGQSRGVRSYLNQGNKFYRNNQFLKAQESYQRALEKDKDSGLISFNLGAAFYKQNKFVKARDSFNRSLLAVDKKKLGPVYYNLGTTEYRYGQELENKDLKAAVDVLTNSVDHFRESLKLEPKDEDVKYNLKLAEEKLKELNEKYQQMKKQSQTNSSQEQENSAGQKSHQSSEPDPKKSRQSDQTDTRQNDKNGFDQKEDQTDSSDDQASQPERKEQPRGLKREDSSSGDLTVQSMDKQQAEFLLESYRTREEPKHMYRQKIELKNNKPVYNEW